MPQPLFTIGHSNHELARLVELLRQHDVEVLVDIRSQPVSRFSPQFNRDSLRRALPDEIRYAFMGDELGGRPVDGRFYDRAGHVLYGALAHSPEFLAAIETIELSATRHRLALLCAEADPLACHRHLLIARVLVERGRDPREVQHILRDGTLRSEEELAPQALPLEGDDAWRSPQPAPAGRRTAVAAQQPALFSNPD